MLEKTEGVAGRYWALYRCSTSCPSWEGIRARAARHPGPRIDFTEAGKEPGAPGKPGSPHKGHPKSATAPPSGHHVRGSQLWSPDTRRGLCVPLSLMVTNTAAERAVSLRHSLRESRSTWQLVPRALLNSAGPAQSLPSGPSPGARPGLAALGEYCRSSRRSCLSPDGGPFSLP